MLRFLRITVLLYILAFVAVGTWVTSCESTDWDAPLHVHVYGVAGDTSAGSVQRVSELGVEELAGVSRFFAAEATRYGVGLAEPFTFFVPTAPDITLPRLPPASARLGTLLWSLRMRWLAARLRFASADPLPPDITLFVVFHEGAAHVALDRSTALRKGLIAVANVFAAPASRLQNDIVIAHELLHTLGATDKYAGPDHLPRHPEGFADPAAVPRYPQSRAELMAGRRPLDARTAELPDSLEQVVIAAQTASEIGWRDGPIPQTRSAGL